MSNHICANCRSVNPPNNQYCGQCGSRLRYHELVEKQPDQVANGYPELFPEVDVKRLGRTLAISLGALVAEAAILRLRRRTLSELTQSGEIHELKTTLRRSGTVILSSAILTFTQRQMANKEDGRQILRDDAPRKRR